MFYQVESGRVIYLICPCLLYLELIKIDSPDKKHNTQRNELLSFLEYSKLSLSGDISSWLEFDSEASQKRLLVGIA